MIRCNNLKVRRKKYKAYFYCTAKKCVIEPYNCAYSCKYFEDKKRSYIQSKTGKNGGIKKKSAKLSKLENNRFSIITDDLTHCIVCGKEKNHLHEVFPGASRINSIKYGMVIPVCVNCHQELHKNGKLTMYYKKLAQTRFEEYYKDIDFVSIFHKNFK